MSYIIGWHDLPAARHVIPAMKVLEYVSPRALEDWEAEMEEEMDRRRECLQEEKDNDTLANRKKKIGPRHTDIEAAVEVGMEADDDSRPKRGAMSLSTPRKRRMADFDEVLERQVSPSKQIIMESNAMDTDSASDTTVDSDIPSKAAPKDSISVYDGWTTTSQQLAVRTLEDIKAEPAPATESISSTATIEPAAAATLPPDPEPEEEAWEVKAIEGYTNLTEDSGLTRNWFQVRWAGDWPPDQNPSWEPEENLPPDMIRKYFKKVQKTTTKAKKAKSKLKQSTLSWPGMKTYDTVADAVAGDLDLEIADSAANTKDELPDNGNEDVFVVDENQAQTETPKTWGINGLGFGNLF